MTTTARRRRDEIVEMYLKEAADHPLLTREQEVALFQRLEAGDMSARDELVRCNLRFVVKVALRYCNCGVPLADLIQEGNIGLLQVVDKFDWRRGFRFSTYAAYYIRQEIQSAIQKQNTLIRLPVRKSRLLLRVIEHMRVFTEREGVEPTAEQIAEDLDVAVEKVHVVLSLRHSFVSMDSDPSEDSQALEDTLVDESAPIPSARVSEEQTAAAVHRALAHLSDRERQVMELRHGIGSGKRALSLRGASKVVGLSQEGVRRVEQRAMGKLRRPAMQACLMGLGAAA